MAHPSERIKMLAGELYSSADPELVSLRKRARRLCRIFNESTEEQTDHRHKLLTQLMAAVGPRVEIEPPFHCDYGFNIHASDNLYCNFGCVFLDCAPIRIGRNVFMGPSVHLYTATHPLEPMTRARGLELAAPITISDDVWIGGSVVVCPGVTIGRGTTIGAGSVVTRDIPPSSVAVGNPCKVVRSL